MFEEKQMPSRIEKIFDLAKTQPPVDSKNPAMIKIRCNTCFNVFEEKIKFGGILIFITCKNCRKVKA